MTYFKNVDLASKYNISEATVRNWVKTTKEGKLNLVLHEENGRTYVANEPSNLKIIEKLVSDNKKYRNTKASKTVTPKPEFYKLFDQNQIYDIVRNLEIHHEIPRQYNYFNGGADEWNQYVQQAAKSGESNSFKQTLELISSSQSYLNSLICNYDKINVIDIGVGNVMPVKNFLEELIRNKKMGRYIAIDTSPRMLEIAEHNAKDWFGDSLEFEGYQIDVTKNHFADILADDYLSKNAKKTANIMFFLGGTPANLRKPVDTFRIINESMNPNDLFITVKRLTTPDMLPVWFTHKLEPGKPKIHKRHRLVFDLLNIDESLYEVEVGFDQRLRQQYAKTKLKVSLTLKFNFGSGERSVEFNKGDNILLWRSWQMNAEETCSQLHKCGFYNLYSSQTNDHEYILTISEVKD